MGDSESMRKLADQYSAEADNLERMVKSCEERKRFANQGGDSKESARQERLIELHQQQRADLLQLSAWLRHYYEA